MRITIKSIMWSVIKLQVIMLSVTVTIYHPALIEKMYHWWLIKKLGVRNFGKNIGGNREPLPKGKTQYSGPPCLY